MGWNKNIQKSIFFSKEPHSKLQTLIQWYFLIRSKGAFFFEKKVFSFKDKENNWI